MIKKIPLFMFSLFLLFICVIQAQEEKVFSYDSKGKRDPLMPLVSAEGYIISTISTEGVKDFRLEGIVCTEGQDNYAVINSSVFRKGDSVGEYKVITIEKEKVVLSDGKEDIVLKLEKGEE